MVRTLYLNKNIRTKDCDGGRELRGACSSYLPSQDDDYSIAPWVISTTRAKIMRQDRRSAGAEDKTTSSGRLLELVIRGSFAESIHEPNRDRRRFCVLIGENLNSTTFVLA
jgi:hypothetical protein